MLMLMWFSWWKRVTIGLLIIYNQVVVKYEKCPWQSNTPPPIWSRSTPLEGGGCLCPPLEGGQLHSHPLCHHSASAVTKPRSSHRALSSWLTLTSTRPLRSPFGHIGSTFTRGKHRWHSSTEKRDLQLRRDDAWSRGVVYEVEFEVRLYFTNYLFNLQQKNTKIFSCSSFGEDKLFFSPPRSHP